MRNPNRRIIIIMLLINIILGTIGCKMVESYKEFFFENISDNHDENYFVSDKLEFAKLENIVFIPEIKEIHHGEYIIYISAFSELGTEQIKIKKVILKENEDVLLEHELDSNILLEKNTDSIFEGWINGGTFSEQEIEVTDGKEYDFTIHAEVIKDDKTISDSITFKIVVKGYKSFVAPT